MHLHGHFSLMKRLDPMAKKGLQNLRDCQSTLQQSSNELPQGLQLVKVCLSHTVPLVGLGGWAVNGEHGERCVSIIPQKEPCSPPPDRRVGYQEVKVGIKSRPRSDKDVHIAQSHRFRIQAL
jgi:hypothetical protein